MRYQRYSREFRQGGRWRRASSVHDVPAAGGVYAFFTPEGRVFYIGSTVNLSRRVKQHIRNRREFENFSIRFRECVYSLYVEMELIKRLRPEGNANGRGR